MRQRILLYIFLLIAFSWTSEVHAQSSAKLKMLEGHVVDSLGLGLKGVNIYLTSPEDTIYSLTNHHGYYKLSGIKGEKLMISYSMIGREGIFKPVNLDYSIDRVILPRVVMYPGISYIDPVHVMKTVPIFNKGDTTVYNMFAFSYDKNSLLEDAFRNNLPGFQVTRDGSTFYHGQLISKVQVDGKKFFGGDILTATKNLPTDFIYQIEVIDIYGDASDAKGIRNSEPEKIINIILKEDKKQITFGQGTAGLGTADRYIGSVGLNRFNKGQEVSIVTSTNNTNTSLFTFGSPNGSGGRTPNLLNIGDFSDQADGLNTINSFAVNFSDQIGKNGNFSMGYNYTQRKNETLGNSLLMSTYYGYQISKRDNFQTLLNDKTHRFNIEVGKKFSNNDIIKIKPSLTINKYSKDNIRDNVLQNHRLTNRGVYRDSSINDNPFGELNILYAKHFNKPGRKMVADFNTSFNNNNKLEDISDSYVIFDTTRGTPVHSVYDQRQLVNQKNKSNTLKAAFSIVEPFYKHSLLEISHQYELTTMEMNRRVENPLAYRNITIDSLALRYDYQFSSNRTGITYQYQPNKKFRTNLGFAIQPLKLVGKVANDTLNHVYENINLIPTASIKYRFNDELDWQFNYQGRNNQPNFFHISPIIDNTNSRNIIVGNPFLKAEFINRFSTSLRKSIIQTGQLFELNLAYNFTANKIVSSKKAGSRETVQETTFRNSDGYYELKGYYTFNTPFINDNFNLEISGSTDYFNNILYINDRHSVTKQYLVNQNIQLRYNWNEYFESVFNTNYGLNHASFELPRKDKISAHTTLFSLGGRGYLDNNLMMGMEFSQKYLKGYSMDISDVNPSIINTYVEYSFLKNRMALLRLECFDLLDQNKNVGVVTEYIGNDIFESRNNRLGRYVMLTMNIRFQVYPKK